MASSTPPLAPQSGWLLLPTIAKLAGWRFKQTWRFLFVTWLGMLAMVTLICALPLFSRVAITADLRTVATNSPDGPNLLFQVESLLPTGTQIQQIEQQLDLAVRQGNLATYLQGSPRLAVQTPPPALHAGGSATPPVALMLDGYDPAQVAQHATLVQGKLPQVRADGSVEIALSQDLANTLGLHAGSTLQGRYPTAFGSSMWTLRVVGLLASEPVHDPFWISTMNPFAAPVVSQAGSAAYNVLAAGPALQAGIAGLQMTSSNNMSCNA